MSVAPFRPNKVYTVSDLKLKLRKANTMAGHQGPEIATTQKLQTVGIDETEYSIAPGVETRHIAETCSKFPTREKEKIRTRDPLRELGCLAANDPKFEAPYSLENTAFGDAVLIVA